MRTYPTKTIKTITLLGILILFIISNPSVHEETLARENKAHTGLIKEPLCNLKPRTIQYLEIPKCTQNDEILTYSAFVLSYNEEHEQASWVAYELTREETYAMYERSDKFIPDLRVKRHTADCRDYKGLGYDKGHLAPAGDMAWSSVTMRESFYYSNISPQEPGFNRGIWKKLEELVRQWARDNRSIYIVTGPVLKKGLPTIGKNKVSVPKYFYKIILDYREPDIKGIGFVIPNMRSNESLQKYALTIDNIEKLTGIDFFHLLPDEQEELIESTLNLKNWRFDTSDIVGKSSTAVMQCKSVTRSGKRCKNKTKNPDGYCYLHENQTHTSRKTEMYDTMN
ncbi:MAG: Endonuclease [Candidatus Jettenia ecosi]|uniref:Endonuclease n=1 Tax=Candidatus Jettenia ecosi TaxID=2494326 RepID=A0A533QKF0_9BACT|nr:MAG: Endonuclease [Candidatus Jettenia ecosi]